MSVSSKVTAPLFLATILGSCGKSPETPELLELRARVENERDYVHNILIKEVFGAIGNFVTASQVYSMHPSEIMENSGKARIEAVKTFLRDQPEATQRAVLSELKLAQFALEHPGSDDFKRLLVSAYKGVVPVDNLDWKAQWEEFQWTMDRQEDMRKQLDSILKYTFAEVEKGKPTTWLGL